MTVTIKLRKPHKVYMTHALYFESSEIIWKLFMRNRLKSCYSLKNLCINDTSRKFAVNKSMAQWMQLKANKKQKED